MRHISIYLVCFVLVVIKANAQYYTGLQQSSWAGVSRVTYNPAIADNKLSVDFNIGAIDVNFNNNLVGTLVWKDIAAKPLYTDYFKPDITINNSIRNMQLPAGFTGTWNVTNSLHIDGPSLLVSFGKRNRAALAFTTHFNSIKNFDNLDAGAAQLLLGASANVNPASFANTAIKSMAWADFGVTYSHVIVDKGANFFKLGGTVKYLEGLGVFYLKGNDGATIGRGTDNNTAILNGSYSYGRSSGFFIDQSSGFDIAKKSPANPSFGGDLGFVYEWRPVKDKYRYDMDGDTGLYRRDKDLYTLAFGFSVMDIGWIGYDKGGTGRNFSGPQTIPTLPLINGVDTLEKFLPKSSAPEVLRAYLPTRFNVYLDYHVGKGFHLNLSSIISLDLSKNKDMFHYVTSFTLTPRYDLTKFGFAFPITYDLNKNFAMGLGLRLGPVFLGTQNVLSYVLKGPTNANFYLGIKINFSRKKPVDYDDDHVSDAKDLCPSMKGVWTARGCPDADFDSIPDSEDKCPNTPGPLKYHGCPDRDGDEVIDKEDSCPDVVGLIKFHGCPDFDNDGVPEPRDQCPNDSGSVFLMGCPDTDGDGVPDKDDRCQEKQGSAAHHGCPDEDGDGVFDDVDECITEKGPPENQGCAWPDFDGDGVPDKDDACYDKAGPASNKGCPLYKDNVKVLPFQSAYDTIYFAPREWRLKLASQQLLDHAYIAMSNKDNAEYTLTISGHTDNTEEFSFAGQDSLSQKRAQACYDYLVKKKGLDPDRVMMEWHGSQQPTAGFLREEDRRRNRVVILLHYVVPGRK